MKSNEIIVTLLHKHIHLKFNGDIFYSNSFTLSYLVISYH